MEKIFIVILMTVWSNGEPEIVQYGTSILADSYSTRQDCEARLQYLAVGQKLKQEKGISGIVRSNLVYRSRDAQGRVDREYSCLEINFKS